MDDTQGAPSCQATKRSRGGADRRLGAAELDRDIGRGLAIRRQRDCGASVRLQRSDPRALGPYHSSDAVRRQINDLLRLACLACKAPQRRRRSSDTLGLAAQRKHARARIHSYRDAVCIHDLAQVSATLANDARNGAERHCERRRGRLVSVQHRGDAHARRLDSLCGARDAQLARARVRLDRRARRLLQRLDAHATPADEAGHEERVDVEDDVFGRPLGKEGVKAGCGGVEGRRRAYERERACGAVDLDLDRRLGVERLDVRAPLADELSEHRKRRQAHDADEVKRDDLSHARLGGADGSVGPRDRHDAADPRHDRAVVVMVVVVSGAALGAAATAAASNAVRGVVCCGSRRGFRSGCSGLRRSLDSSWVTCDVQAGASRGLYGRRKRRALALEESADDVAVDVEARVAEVLRGRATGGG